MYFLGKEYSDNTRRIYTSESVAGRVSKGNSFSIAKNAQKWHGFTLNRGHIFGVFRGGYYVSTGEIVEFRKDKFGNRTAVYQLYYERGTADNYKWYGSKISERTELGKLIAATAAKKQPGVSYKPMKFGEWKQSMRNSNVAVSGFAMIK